MAASGVVAATSSAICAASPGQRKRNQTQPTDPKTGYDRVLNRPGR
jgi:hypothetical protein